MLGSAPEKSPEEPGRVDRMLTALDLKPFEVGRQMSPSRSSSACPANGFDYLVGAQEVR